MNKKIIFSSLSLLFVVAIIVILYSLFHTSQSSQPRPSAANKPLKKISVRLAWLNQAQFAGMYVAKEKGFYTKHGLDVNLKEYEFDNDQSKELSENKIDFSVASATEFLKGVSHGYKVKALAVIFQDSPYAFASLKSSNITSPADFKGKKLGREGGNDQAKITYPAVFQPYGIKDADVKYVDLQFDEANDLTQKRADVIDLYRTDQPYIMKKQGVEINVLYPEKFGFKQYGDVIEASDSLINEHPETVKNFMTATLEGWEYAINNVPESVDITMKYDNTKYHDKEYETYILNGQVPLIRPTGGKHIGNMEFIQWRQTYDALLNAGVLDKEFDVSSIYTNEFLK